MAAADAFDDEAPGPAYGTTSPSAGARSDLA
jgi:hypothetical protein